MILSTFGHTFGYSAPVSGSVATQLVSCDDTPGRAAAPQTAVPENVPQSRRRKVRSWPLFNVRGGGLLSPEGIRKQAENLEFSACFFFRTWLALGAG